MSRCEISVIMSYFQRPMHLRNTLESYKHFYFDIKDEYEVVIVDDSSYREKELLDLAVEYGDDINIKTEYVDRRNQTVRGPGVIMNIAAEIASGELLALTNPENMHCGPVLLDAIENVHEGLYRVYGCRTLKEIPRRFELVLRDPGAFSDGSVAGGWYVHSKHHPRKLHFMSVIHRNDWGKVGGFDPEYDKGCGYDDDDLACAIEAAGIKTEIVDDPHVAHQWHPRQHWDFGHATRRNAEYFRKKWGK